MRVLTVIMVVVLLGCGTQALNGDEGGVTEKKIWQWWDQNATDPASLTVNFVYKKKLQSRSRPVRRMGHFLFKRVKDKPFMLMSIHKIDKSDRKNPKEGKLENRILITSKKYWSYTPAREDEKAQLRKSDLSLEGNSTNSKILATGLIYAYSYSRLKKDYAITITQELETSTGDWSFELRPRQKNVAKYLPKIIVDMNKQKIKRLFYSQPNEEFLEFSMTKVDANKAIKDKDLALEVPEGTVIVIPEDEKKAQEEAQKKANKKSGN